MDEISALLVDGKYAEALEALCRLCAWKTRTAWVCEGDGTSSPWACNLFAWRADRPQRTWSTPGAGDSKDAAYADAAFNACVHIMRKPPVSSRDQLVAAVRRAEAAEAALLQLRTEQPTPDARVDVQLL
jgi:hypothetical protein